MVPVRCRLEDAGFVNLLTMVACQPPHMSPRPLWPRSFWFNITSCFSNGTGQKSYARSILVAMNYIGYLRLRQFSEASMSTSLHSGQRPERWMHSLRSFTRIQSPLLSLLRLPDRFSTIDTFWQGVEHLARNNPHATTDYMKADFTFSSPLS